jgi:uncharacterized membrane protein YkvA (DUF1232 family)
VAENKKPNLLVERDESGAPRGLGSQVKLILRLLRDGRVNPLLKLIPVVSVIYLISPLDAFIPVIDDAVVLCLGMYAFVELSPVEIVTEHRAAIAAEGNKG